MRLIDGSASAEQAQQRLSEWGPRSYAYQKIGDVLFTSTVKADLAGQLLVRTGIDQRIQLSAPKREPSFLDKPWEDALAYFRNRVPSNQNELSTLLRGYAQRADVARLLMLKQIREEVNAQLEKALIEGSTYQEFARALANGDQSLGITNADPHYLKMVFRTNLQSAYGAGRFKAMMDPVVQNARPIAGYRTVGDARVGEDHRPLDGTCYEITSDTWHRICPPNRPNCRCSMVAMTREEAAGKEILGEVPKEYVPNPDFDSPPTARIPISALTKDEQQEVKRPVQVGVPDKLVPETIAKPPEEKRKAPEPQAPGSDQPHPQTSVRATPGVGIQRESQEHIENVFGKQMSAKDMASLAGGKSGFKLVGEVVPYEVVKDKESMPAAKLYAAVHDDSGGPVGRIERTYYRDKDQQLVVKQDLFRLLDEAQGSGIGKRVFNAQMDAYARMGVERVELEAAWAGPYVWTRAGFQWSDEEDIAYAIKAFTKRLEKQYPGVAWAGKIKTPMDIATFVGPDGSKLGKTFLTEIYDELGYSIAMHGSPSKLRL